MELVQKHKVKYYHPSCSGWFDTDKGTLYWMSDKKEWSCRDDRLSEEYPVWWLSKAIAIPIGEIKDTDIAAIEVIHDRLIDTYGENSNELYLVNARRVTQKLYNLIKNE